MAIGLVAGLVAALGPAAPTATPVIDAVLITLAVLAIVVVGERAPWWSVALAAGVAMAIAINPLLIAVAVVALAGALWSGSGRRPRPEVLAASVGITCNVLCRAELRGSLGLSAAISIAVLAIVFVTGIRRRSKRVRRLAWGGVFGLVVLAGAASAAFGYQAYRSRHDLGAGQSTAELGVVALENGKFDEAADWFRQSAAILDQANARMDSPWTAAAALVPVVAQHRSAIVDMSEVGASGAKVVAESLSEIDPESLRTDNGRIDLEGLARLQAPLERVQQALEQLQRTTAESRSPWLAEPGGVPARRLRREHRRAPALAGQGARRDPRGPADARRRRAAQLPRAVHHPVGVAWAGRHAGHLRRAARGRRCAVARQHRSRPGPRRSGPAGRCRGPQHRPSSSSTASSATTWTATWATRRSAT